MFFVRSYRGVIVHLAHVREIEMEKVGEAEWSVTTHAHVLMMCDNKDEAERCLVWLWRKLSEVDKNKGFIDMQYFHTNPK